MNGVGQHGKDPFRKTSEFSLKHRCVPLISYNKYCKKLNIRLRSIQVLHTSTWGSFYCLKQQSVITTTIRHQVQFTKQIRQKELRSTLANAVHCQQYITLSKTQVVFSTVLSAVWGLVSGLKQLFKQTSCVFMQVKINLQVWINKSHLFKFTMSLKRKRFDCNAAECPKHSHFSFDAFYLIEIRFVQKNLFVYHLC